MTITLPDGNLLKFALQRKYRKRNNGLKYVFAKVSEDFGNAGSENILFGTVRIMIRI